MTQKSTRRGFTLIELLVVVLIIGILAAVALPQYNKAVKRSQGRELTVALNALDKALADYYVTNGTYEGVSPDTLNIVIPELKYFKYGKSSNNSESDTLTSQAITIYDNNYITISFKFPNGKYAGFSWRNGKADNQGVNHDLFVCEYIDGHIWSDGSVTFCIPNLG